LKNYSGFTHEDSFIESYKQWIDQSCQDNNIRKESKWSESIAVGDKSFVEKVNDKLGIKVKSRSILEREETYIVRETSASYNSDFGIKKQYLRPKNMLFWNLSDYYSIT
jgi:hypothetical protein